MFVLSSDDELRSQIGKWLDPPDPSSNHVAALEKRCSETGGWFVDGEQFLSWKESVRSFLWIHGICRSMNIFMVCDFLTKSAAGSGKSILW